LQGRKKKREWGSRLLSAISFQYLVISFQPSAISEQEAEGSVTQNIRSLAAMENVGTREDKARS